jgi:hypothetical protein
MEYTVEIELELPRRRVLELFDDQDNMPKWMEGLQSFEHLSGTPGRPGARSKLVFLMGKRRIEMIETVTVRNLPDEFSGTYDAKGMHNAVENHFVELAPQRTNWISHNVFELSGFMKVMGWIMKGAFVKQSLKYMRNFKAFAEEGKVVNDPH